MGQTFANNKPGSKSFADAHRGTAEIVAEHLSAERGPLILSAAPLSGLTSFLQATAFSALGRADAGFVFRFTFASGETAKDAAKRTASEFLSGYVANSRREAAPSIGGWPSSEIVKMAGIGDLQWIERAVERIAGPGEKSIEQCLSIIELAIRAGRKIAVITDEIHHAAAEPDGLRSLILLRQLSENLGFPLVLAGRRRSFSEIRAQRTIAFERLLADSGLEFSTEAAGDLSLDLDDASLDLLATQTGGRPGLITDILRRLKTDEKSFDGFASIQRAYCEEVFGGSCGKWFDKTIDDALGTRNRVRAFEIFGDARSNGGSVPLALFQDRMGFDEARAWRAAAMLNSAEIVDRSAYSIERSNAPTIIDLFESRTQTELHREPRALVFSSLVASMVSRSTTVMAGRYRRQTAIGVKDVLASFDGRPVPAVLFDPKNFAEKYKGNDRTEIGVGLSAETEHIELPNIVFSASIESIYPQIAAQLDQERGAFAVGFPKHRFGSEDRVFWLAAEIESKLPATAELTEFWCDRLEAAAVSAGLENCRLWLITPDGFEDDACDILTGRGSVGSSRMQAEFILEILKNKMPATADLGAEEMAEYEIVIPMSGESELIAAHTLEEIAKRHGFMAHDINQIKTALVEACINAVEHSHSPDRRIRQKFTVGRDKITIDVTNRGLRLADAPRPAADSARRGWGLKLMEKLMDEVTINDTDDGTSITMVKQLKAA